ncbi:MAG: hypothetical protein IT558_04755 [Alphaproteobacteria bacterium]|nr:hypothetical protein [Alphaproteobacteria bacterium]
MFIGHDPDISEYDAHCTSKQQNPCPEGLSDFRKLLLAFAAVTLLAGIASAKTEQPTHDKKVLKTSLNDAAKRNNSASRVATFFPASFESKGLAIDLK